MKTNESQKSNLPDSEPFFDYSLNLKPVLAAYHVCSGAFHIIKTLFIMGIEGFDYISEILYFSIVPLIN